MMPLLSTGQLFMFLLDRCIKFIHVPQHSEPAVCESNFMVLDAFTSDGEGNSYTIALDEVGSDIAACEAIRIHAGESPCDWYDLVMLACGMMTTFVLLFDDCIILASPRKLAENFAAKCERETG
jgi:hypothetical protein